MVPALADTLMHDEDEIVRIEAARVLNIFGAAAYDAKPAMFSALGDESGMVRTQAADFFMKFGKQGHKELLLSLLTNDPRRFAVVAKSLSQCRHKAVRVLIPRLLALSHHSDQSVRADVVSALCNIGEPLTLDILNSLLHDPDGQVRAQAVLAVERVIKKPQQLIQVIQPLLKDDCPEVRQHVVQILGRIPGDQPILTLISHHLHRESDVMTNEITRRVKERLELTIVQQGRR
jgi:HEAT repeat protein